MSDTTTRLCITCKHYEASSYSSSLDKCRSPLVVRFDLVRGQDKPSFCETQRSSKYGCSERAVYWEQRDE